MKTMSEYWEYRQDVAAAALLYAAYQAGRCVIAEVALRGFEQLAIPVEAALADEEPPYGDVS